MGKWAEMILGVCSIGMCLAPEDGAGGGASGAATATPAAPAAAATPAATPSAPAAYQRPESPAAPAAAQTPGGANIADQLPEAYAAKYGVKTLAELTQNFERAQEQVHLAQRYVQLLEAKAQRTGNPADAQAAAQAGAQAQQQAAKFYNWNSEKEYWENYEKNPQKSLVELMKAIARGEAESLTSQAVNPLLETEAERQQQAQQQAIQEFHGTQQQRLDAVMKSDPRFVQQGPDGKPGALFPALQTFLTKNHDRLLREAQADPDFDVYEYAKERVLDGIARAAGPATEERLKLANVAASTARPGAGGAVGLLPGTRESAAETAQRINAQMIGSGQRGWTNDELKTRIQQLENAGL